MFEDILLVTDKPMRAPAVGRVRTLESRLLDTDFINRIIDSASLDESLQILGESPDYQQSIGSLSNSAGWDDALSRHLQEIVILTGLLLEDSEGFTLLRLKWDVHNAKIILKSSYLKPSIMPRFVECGNWSVDCIREGMEEKRWHGACGKYIAPVIEAGKTAYEQMKDIQAVELAMDRSEMEMTVSMLPDRKPYFLYRYFQSRIDLTNIKIAIRLHILKKPKQYAVIALSEGGTVSKSLYIDSWEEPLSSLISRLAKTNAGYVFSAAFDSSRENEGEDIDKAILRLPFQFAAIARRIPFGFPPVAGYLFAKENEVAVLRTILSGKANGISKDAIRQMLWS